MEEQLCEASENGNVEVVKLLLQDNRIDPSYNDNYAIGMASYNRHEEVVWLLLQDHRVGRNNLFRYACVMDGYI